MNNLNNNILDLSPSFSASSAKLFVDRIFRITICMGLFCLFNFSTSQALNITIVESQSMNVGHDMDFEWNTMLLAMGHNPVIVPQTALDNNTFFATTDILIISSGTITLPANRVSTILQFLQTGKGVYIQSEYLASYSTNMAFESIITSCGGFFSWGAPFSGDLQPMNVVGTFATTNNIVPSIGYFWFSTAGSGDCNLINMLEYGGAYHGFQYVPQNPAYGSIITTTDQDWIRATTSTQLMENIITHLISPVQTSSGPPINLGNDTTLCVGTILTLDVTTSNAAYLWQDNSTNPVFNVAQSGTYWVQVTANGCVSTDTIQVNFTTLPVINLGADTTLCDGQVIILDATTSNASYLWQDNSTNATFTATQSGFYIVQIITACGIVSDTIQLNFIPLPLISLGNDTTLCTGDNIILGSVISNATYLWQDNNIGSNITVSQPGIYWVAVTVNGCTAVDSIIINYNASPVINLGSDITLCQGETVTLDATTPGGSYLWQDNSTNAQLIVSLRGIYWVEVTVNGCSALDSISVNVNALPVVNLGNDITVCQGENIVLDATVLNGTYLWQDNSTGSTFNVSQPGIYSVTVIVNGCANSDSITINFTSLPVINLGSDSMLCDGETLILDATTAGGSYNWQNNSTNAQLVVSLTGIYWVEVTVNNCTAVDSILVNYIPLPVVNLGNDITVCQGENIILDATTVNGNYLWQDSSTGSAYTVTQSGIYWVEVTVNNCSAVDSVLVNFNPLPLFSLGSDLVLCEGQTVTIDATTPNATYLWQNNTTGPLFNVTQSGTYSVIVTVNGCSSTDSLTAFFNPVPSVSFGNDTTLCNGEEFILNAAYPGATYLWQDNSTASSFVVVQPGIYEVTVTANNCNYTEQINIEMDNCNVILEMPNIFTPNGDGNNETFYPIIMEGITKANLSIFDRWGKEVFQTGNLEIGWDGKVHGKICSDGTFLWIVEYSTIKNQQLNQKGTVMLIGR